MQQLQEAWQQVQAAPVEAAGTPHLWLDFKAPFADPPPVFVPPKPEPGPEPQLVLPTDLQEPPVYQPPVPQVRLMYYTAQTAASESCVKSMSQLQIATAASVPVIVTWMHACFRGTLLQCAAASTSVSQVLVLLLLAPGAWYYMFIAL
jgi:hypothetical protein